MSRLIGSRATWLLWLAAPCAALAAGVEVSDAMSSGWSFEPWTVVPIVLVAACYLAGLLRMRSARRRRVVAPTRIMAFVLGTLALIVALMSPLDAWAEHLFAAHMVQHLVLMMVAPPLLVWARPGITLLWAFPIAARRAIGRAWSRTPDAARFFARLMHPLSVYVLASVAFWFWHLPGPYDAALASEPVHVAEHLCLFVTSLAFWNIVIEPYGARRLGYGASFAFVATFALQCGLLGALLTFASRPLYGAYAHAGEVFGLTALEDQQLAGILMWVPSSAIQLAALIALFTVGMRNAETRALAAARGFTRYSGSN